MGYGLRYEYGIFRQTIDGRLAARAARQLAARSRSVGGRAAARNGGNQAGLLVRGARRDPARGPGQALDTSGHSLRSPGRGLRRQDHQHAAALGRAAPDFFDFQAFSAGEFVSALAEQLAAESVTRVLYPDDSTSMGRGLRFVQEYFLVACSLADLVRRFRRQQCRLEHAARQGRHPAQRHPSEPRRPGADAHPARRGRPRMGPGLGSHPAHARLHQPHAAARGAGEMAVALVRADAAAPSRDHPGDQPPSPGRGADAVSQRGRARPAGEPRRGGRRAQDPDGQPRHRRLAQHQRRRRHPFATCCAP